MRRPTPLFAALALLAFSCPAFGQTSASTGLLANIRSSSIGTGYSSSSVNNGVLNQVRGRAASNGISSVSVTNSSIPSGPSGISRPATKPFTSLDRGSTISPYLQLFNESFNDTVDNYNAFVRPNLEQQRFNQSLQRQQQQINQRVQSISARPAFRPQGSDQIMPTGHAATYGYYSRFYPRLNRRR